MKTISPCSLLGSILYSITAMNISVVSLEQIYILRDKLQERLESKDYCISICYEDIETFVRTYNHLAELKDGTLYISQSINAHSELQRCFRTGLSTYVLQVIDMLTTDFFEN